MKKYRNIGRILFFLLVLAMLLPGIGMRVSSADIPCGEAGCSGAYVNGICSADAAHYEAATAEDGVYRIGNAGQLYWFAALVNGGANEYEAGDNGEVYNAVLTADITVNAENGENPAWTPIGLYTGAREYIRYSGTFDGAGHTISGIYYNNTGYTGRTAGLFGCLDSNGTVKDLTLADSRISGAADIGGIVSHNYGTVSGCVQLGSVSGTGTTGGIVSRNMEGGRVENCRNEGTVSGAVTGGIAGENAAAIAGCVNSGTVDGTNSVGGIAGINSGSLEACVNSARVTGANTHVGGVAGNHVAGEITRCGSSGAVSGGSDYIGGVAGVCSGASISESYNTGAVTGAEGSDAVGGVVGAIDGTNLTAAAVTACFNTADVTGRSWVGGIAGVSGYLETPQDVSITNSYSTGAVTGTSYSGAVVGALNKGTVSGVYYLDGAQNTVSGAAAATAERFASGEICYLLNSSASEGDLVWYQTIGTDASPRFEGEVVYYDSASGAYYNEIPDVAYNTTTQAGFDTVKEALDAARAGETVKLLCDTAQTKILVTPGLTLDLNGCELTSTYVVAFETAHIIDSAGTGRLVTGLDTLLLDETNAMLPVYDGSGYIFSRMGYAFRQDTAYTDGYKLYAMAYFANMDAVELLKDGAADNNLQILIQLTWDNGDNVASQRFTFSETTVTAVYDSNGGSPTKYGKNFEMVVTGIESVGNLRANIVVVSGTYAEYVSGESAITG